MVNRLRNISAVLTLTLFSCGMIFTSDEKATGYNLGVPDASHILPDILQEISGLTYLDSTSFACIQDEKGILFIYDIIKNEIRKQYAFHIDGDYEGITRVGKTIYVLRSDGVLFEISDYESKDFRLSTYVTGIPSANNEGLCYDSDSNRLLIACKGKINKGPEFKDKRAIYGFDLRTKTLSPKPVFDFDLKGIVEFAVAKQLNIPAKQRKPKEEKAAGPFIKFRTSAIGIHSRIKKLYLLSAADHLLFIFNMNGTLEHIEQLDPVIFNKAEGITFFENGDMLITNEGQDKKPTLLHFKYRRM